MLLLKVNALINRYRGLLVKNGVIALGNLVIEPAKRRVTIKNAEVKLAPKEYEGYDRAVDTHIKKLRAALGDYGSHIETVIKTGYKWRS